MAACGPFQAPSEITFRTRVNKRIITSPQHLEWNNMLSIPKVATFYAQTVAILRQDKNGYYSLIKLSYNAPYFDFLFNKGLGNVYFSYFLIILALTKLGFFRNGCLLLYIIETIIFGNLHYIRIIQNCVITNVHGSIALTCKLWRYHTFPHFISPL